MNRFFDALSQVIEWWYNTWYDLFGSVITPTNYFYRAIIYSVFTLSIMGFGIDLIFSFILSFKAKKVIIFNPLKIKSYFTQDNRNTVKSYYRDRILVYNRSFSSLAPRQKDNVFYKDRNLSFTRSYSTLSPLQKDNVFYKQRLPLITYRVYPIRGSFFFPYNLKFFRVPESKPISFLMDRHFDSVHSRLYSINSEKNFHNVDSRNFNSFDSKRFRGLEAYHYSVPQFRFISCLNPKFLSYLYFNRYQIMAYANGIRAIRYKSLLNAESDILHMNGFKSEIFRVGHYLYHLDNSGVSFKSREVSSNNSNKQTSSQGSSGSKSVLDLSQYHKTDKRLDIEVTDLNHDPEDDL